MDRQTIYFGQVPLETDLLHAQQDAMVALGVLTQTISGSAVLVDGFTCTPTTPASLNVVLNPGAIYQLANLEATPWSSLPADVSHSIVKQGIQLDPVVFGITPPGTVGFSQVFLIEVQYADLDTGSTTLPYFNAANPSIAFNGPGGAGTAQNTVRKGLVAAQVKAGIAAPNGSQVAPTADAGWTGLFTVTVAQSDTTVSAGKITTLPTAPFLQQNGKLPQIPVGVQSGTWDYAVDTGSGGPNAIVCALSPIPASYLPGMNFAVKVANAVSGATTINVNGLGGKSVVHKDGSALIAGDLPAGAIANLRYDGVNFQLLGSGGVAAGGTGTWGYGSDYFADTSATANVITGAPSTLPTAYAAGEMFLIKVANTVTGSTTINVTGTTGALGAKNLVFPGGGLIQAGDIVAGQVIRVGYDGTQFIMLSPISQAVIDTAITLTANTGIFTDLNAMTAWLSRRRIDQRGGVTLSFPAGAYSYSTSQIFEHPDGRRVTIQGGAVTSPPAGASATFATLASAFATQLTFTGATGLVIRGVCGGVNNLMVIGGTGHSGTGIIFNNSVVSTLNLAASKCGAGGILFVRSQASINTTYAVSNTGNGVEADTSWVIFSSTLASNANTGAGIEGVFGGYFGADTTIPGIVCANGNTGYGAFFDRCDGSFVGGSSGQIRSNTAGQFAAVRARFNIGSLGISGTSGIGITYQQAVGDAQQCVCSNPQEIQLLQGANLVFTGSSFTGTVSPPFNAYGQAGNSFLTY